MRLRDRIRGSKIVLTSFKILKLLISRCRGTSKWVHQACIQRWVDEKQKGNFMAAVECPQCATKYVIHLPSGSYFVSLLDKGELIIGRSSGYIAAGVCVGAVYWTCVTYGAVTLMQTMGQRQCLIVMERAGKD